MQKNILFASFFIIFKLISFGQEVAQYNDFEIYTQDKNNKILIIPFENKMYASSVDSEIAAFNKIPYKEVKEEIKIGISAQILLTISNKIPAISMAHHKDSIAEVLNYIYNSIGLKYDQVKSKDTLIAKPRKTDLIKDKLNSFIKHTKQDLEKNNSKKENIQNGEIHTTSLTGERFMNVIIQNPNLLSELNEKYRTNYYLFINEFHIGRSLSVPENIYIKKREISTHYTVFNQMGIEVDAGVVKVLMPSDVVEIKKIENEYLSIIASELCSFIPKPKIGKPSMMKEAEDNKNSKKQRKVIHGVLE